MYRYVKARVSIYQEVKRHLTKSTQHPQRAGISMGGRAEQKIAKSKTE